MLSFKPIFSTPLFYFHQEVFSSSLSAIRLLSYTYLSLLIFFPAILIPACVSSSLVFCVIYSAYKLNMHYCLYFSFILKFITSFKVLCWSIADLQYRVGFEYTAGWFSYAYIHSSRLSQNIEQGSLHCTVDPWHIVCLKRLSHLSGCSRS